MGVFKVLNCFIVVFLTISLTGCLGLFEEDSKPSGPPEIPYHFVKTLAIDSSIQVISVRELEDFIFLYAEKNYESEDPEPHYYRYYPETSVVEEFFPVHEDIYFSGPSFVPGIEFYSSLKIPEGYLLETGRYLYLADANLDTMRIVGNQGTGTSQDFRWVDIYQNHIRRISTNGLLSTFDLSYDMLGSEAITFSQTHVQNYPMLCQENVEFLSETQFYIICNHDLYKVTYEGFEISQIDTLYQSGEDFNLPVMYQKQDSAVIVIFNDLEILRFEGEKLVETNVELSIVIESMFDDRYRKYHFSDFYITVSRYSILVDHNDIKEYSAPSEVLRIWDSEKRYFTHNSQIFFIGKNNSLYQLDILE